MATSNNRLDGDIPTFDLDAVLGVRDGNTLGHIKLFERKWSVRNDPDGLMLMKFMSGRIDQDILEVYAIENMVIDEETEDWAEVRANHSGDLSYNEWKSLGRNILKMWLGIPLEQQSSSESGSEETDS